MDNETHTQSGVPTTRTKILWLSIVQGWAILLVLIGHVNCFTYSQPGEVFGFGASVTRLCYAFHMPLFMFVSGGLLYYSRLSRGWSTRALYIDKFKRLVLPYIFFIFFAMLLKGVLGSYTKRGAVDMNLHTFISALFDPANGPLGEMWFVATLLWFMMMYPLFRAAMRNLYTECGLLCLTLLPFIVGTDWHIDGLFNLAGVPRYAFFFFGGMMFFKYGLYRYAQHRLWVTLMLITAFALCYVFIPGNYVVTASAGILMSVALGVTLEEHFPAVFSSFRDYSFQIFLIGIFPQMFLELFVWRKVADASLQIPFYIVSCALAIMVAVATSKSIEKVPLPLIRRLFGLK